MDARKEGTVGFVDVSVCGLLYSLGVIFLKFLSESPLSVFVRLVHLSTNSKLPGSKIVSGKSRGSLLSSWVF